VTVRHAQNRVGRNVGANAGRGSPHYLRGEYVLLKGGVSGFLSISIYSPLFPQVTPALYHRQA
jgi:hypothetical protein